MSTKWPESVPVLSAGDLVRGQYTCGERHCLRGWQFTVFKNIESQGEVSDALEDETFKVIGGRNVVVLNDREEYPLSLVAQVWNRAMKRLGYTEIYDQ